MNLKQTRLKNIDLIKEKYNLFIPEHLPLLEVSNFKRDAIEVSNRIDILHLLYSIYINGKESKEFFYDLIQENFLSASLTEKENEILNKRSLDDQDIIDFSWGKEALYAFLWALGIIDEDISIIKEIDLSDYYEKIPPELSKESFIKSIKYRSKENIMSMLDLIYLIHWFYRNNDKEGLSIVIERRKALEWLLYDNSWSDISLDT